MAGVCVHLSVICDYAITGSTPHGICEAGELTHFPWCRIYALVYWVWGTGSALVQVMAGCLFGAKPLPKVILTYCQLHTWQLQWNSNKKTIHSWKRIWIHLLRNSAHFVQGRWVKSVPRPTYACDCMYIWLTQNVNLARQEERGSV